MWNILKSSKKVYLLGVKKVKEKKWLIRTRNQHILGPITKNKLMELLNEGSLNEKDEVCSGNGYWFFVKEKDLLNKYIYENNLQSFNPVSEAKLTKAVLENDNPQIPSEDDLAYPDITVGPVNYEHISTSSSGSSEKKELPAQPEVLDVENEKNNVKYPSGDDLNYPDLEKKK